MAASKILPVSIPKIWNVANPIIQDLLSRVSRSINTLIDDVDTLSTSSSGWTVVLKNADETVNNSAVFQDDDELTFALAASTNYVFRAAIFFSSNDTADFKFSWNGPTTGSPTLGFTNRFIAPNGTSFTINTDTAWNATTQVTYSAGGSNGYIFTEGWIHNGSTAGNLVFQWAQVVGTVTNTVVRAGSYIEWMQA